MHYMLALTYLKAGRLDDAVAEFEKQLSRPSLNKIFWAIWAVKTHYYLGIAYEKSNWNAKAIEQYETFLELWKDTDTDHEVITDTKARLARLHSTS